MRERKLTINLTWANIFSIILLAVTALVALILFRIIWEESTTNIFGLSEELAEAADLVFIVRLFLVVIAYLGGIIIHELIHGITWARYAPGGWKSISFGVMWKMLTPYCHCDKPLKVRHYVLGALAPLVALGILPIVTGLCFCSMAVLVYGIIFTSAAAGDILVVWKLRHEPAENTVLDHPTEAGCIIYEE